MAVTVEEILASPILREARIVGGREAVSERVVRWTAVIEWPVENFVRPGDFVLTTALGCDADRFEQLVSEIADSGAAALCVSLHDGGELVDIPESVVDLADKLRFPLISVPWNVRFAEIMMAATDRLIAQQYAAALEEPNHLSSGFTRAILAGAGLDAIAEALERLLERAVVILDVGFRVAGAGGLARTQLPDVLRTLENGAETDSKAEVERLRRTLDSETPRRVSGLPELDLGPGTIIAARARRRLLAFIYISEPDDSPIIPALEARAVEHAATAVAIEMLRLHAIADAEARVRGDFFWGLAAGVASRDEIAANAFLLGYDLTSHHALAAGVVGGPTDSEEARTARAEQLAQELRDASNFPLIVTVRRDRLLVLASPETRSDLIDLLDRAQKQLSDRMRGNWGVASEAVTLLELAKGYRDAVRALEIGAVVKAPAGIADARALGPYLMLDVLARDTDALTIASSTIAPLLEHDRATSRNLLTTLEVFLQENGNTSAAARALYLNRHSLMYRLGKIETLTGRSLASYEDRFMLDLCIKLHHLAARREASSLGYSIVDDRAASNGAALAGHSAAEPEPEPEAENEAADPPRPAAA